MRKKYQLRSPRGILSSLALGLLGFTALSLTASASPSNLVVRKLLPERVTTLPPDNFPPVWVTAATLNLAQNASIGQNLVATDPENDSITYALSGGSLPSGLSLNSAGRLSGTTNSSAGSFNFTVTATDSYGNTTPRTFTGTQTCPGIMVSGQCSLAIFSTSSIQANFGGIAGADAACASAAAQNPALPSTGVYRAWLSTSNVYSAPAFSNRFAGARANTNPFVTPDGAGFAVVASNWSALTGTGSLSSIINSFSGSGLNGGLNWSNTNRDGTRNSTSTCNDWTSNSSSAPTSNSYTSNNNLNFVNSGHNCSQGGSGIRLICVQTNSGSYADSSPPIWLSGTGVNYANSNSIVTRTLSAFDPDDDAITYTLTAGSLPPGLSLSSSGVV